MYEFNIYFITFNQAFKHLAARDLYISRYLQHLTFSSYFACACATIRSPITAYVPLTNAAALFNCQKQLGLDFNADFRLPSAYFTKPCKQISASSTPKQ